MTLEEFNVLLPQQMMEALFECCSSRRWAGEVAGAAPFDSLEALHETARTRWLEADEKDWLEGFSGHPRIGDLEALRNRFATTATAEQGQVASAEEEVLTRLKTGNDQYMHQNGFIFIVFATGKSAAEMLALLEERLTHSRETELVIAAGEQAEITALRLEKLVEEGL